MPIRSLSHCPQGKWRGRIRPLACLLTVTLSSLAANTQQPTTTSATPDPSGTPVSWAEAANRNELVIVRTQGDRPLRYRQRKINARGDTTRIVIESKQGNVARLLQRNGQPLTVAEDIAERARLDADLESPEEFARHHKRAADMRDEALQLIPILTHAMLYSYASGQPQPKNSKSLQVVLDFRPNPAFRPPTMVSEALTGMQGRFWIDAKSHCITRIDANVLHPVNFGFGILAKIFPGGTVEFEQTHVTADRWVYSRLEEHLTARILLVRTLPENTTITSWDFHSMPAQISYQEAIRALLSMPVPLR